MGLYTFAYLTVHKSLDIHIQGGRHTMIVFMRQYSQQHAQYLTRVSHPPSHAPVVLEGLQEKLNQYTPT